MMADRQEDASSGARAIPRDLGARRAASHDQRTAPAGAWSGAIVGGVNLERNRAGPVATAA